MTNEDTKFCAKCQRDVPIGDFYRNAARSDGLGGYCRFCQFAVNEATSKRQRSELIAAMGGCCVRCGYSDARALQIDHINGGGRSEDPIRTSAKFYKKVLDNPGMYQLLCACCNIIKRLEEGEHVGNRDYGRVPPTERKKGVGRHNPEANARRAAGLAKWRAENPDELREAGTRANADPEGRARRAAAAKAYWAEDGPKQQEHRRKINEAKRRDMPE